MPVPHHEVPSAGYTFAKLRHKPTFVLVDASGEEIARFGFQPTSPAFAQAIETALARTGAT